MKEILSAYSYSTDFEITIRDNTAYQLTVDLEQSTLILPSQKV